MNIPFQSSLQLAANIPKFLLALSVVAGCTPRWQPHANGWAGYTLVACGSVADLETRTNIQATLTSNRIECFIESSVVYGVYVRTKDAERAVEVLEQANYHTTSLRKVRSH
jgi:hypothetical protein